MEKPNAAFPGGTGKWIRRMKRILPGWSFVSAEDDSIGGYNALESTNTAENLIRFERDLCK